MGKKQNFKELIYDMYSHDYGIDINIGAIEKANYLANTGTYIDIYILDISPEDLHRNKA